MIVQAIGLLDDLDKELNTYAMRVREWYGWHFPEMTRVVTDNIQYALAVRGGDVIQRCPAHAVPMTDSFCSERTLLHWSVKCTCTARPTLHPAHRPYVWTQAAPS